MASILFVHGTGVRQQSYEKTFATLADWKKTKSELEGFKLDRCIWGDVHGARPLGGGASIPGYEGAASARPADEVVKWWLLYQNPYFELESLREQGDRELAPRVRAAWTAKKDQIAGGALSPEFNLRLKSHRLDGLWPAALDRVTGLQVWKDVLPPRDVDVTQFFPDFCRCTAEAVMAETALAALAEGVPAPTAEGRNQIVDHYLQDLKAKVRGPRDWYKAVAERVKRLSLTMYAAGDYALSQVVTTPVVRSFVTDQSLPAIGDILFYQARGQRIRDWIEAEIGKLEAPVFLLAHSLGGIACVDLLVLKPDLRSKVAGLITAGSQSPLFYEMDCLVSLPRTAAQPAPGLPPHFPPWLNFHDPNDYLGYAARPAFHDDPRIEDVEVASRQPRLMAHSAYWSEPALWDGIAAFVQTHREGVAKS
jgi:hypothetical protein